MARTRRTRKEVIAARMEKLDQRINALQKKTVALQDEQDKLAQQLADIEQAEKRADEEKAQKELLKLIRKSGRSAEEIKEYFSR